MKSEVVRLDHRLIVDIIEPGSKILDLGCGSGELMLLLVEEKNAKAQGIELDESAIYKCVAKGLSVFHGDIDSGLAEYGDKSFDYVILNQSLQQVRHVDEVLTGALRVGRKVIVGIPNFAYYKARLQLFFRGRVPVTSSLPYSWYETPNLHFLSLYDFIDYCKVKRIKIEETFYIAWERCIRILPNLYADSGIFVIKE